MPPFHWQHLAAIYLVASYTTMYAFFRLRPTEDPVEGFGRWLFSPAYFWALVVFELLKASARSIVGVIGPERTES